MTVCGKRLWEDISLFSLNCFFPKIHDDIDWKKGYTFLDKELEKIVRDAKAGTRRVEKLVRVHLRNGKKTLILIHIEIQGYGDAVFGERMFIYYYRLSDRYKLPVVSLAVLTDTDPDFKPEKYVSERYGCSLKFRFPVIKLADWRKKWDNLEKNPNPLAVVVMAHLKAQEFGRGKEMPYMTSWERIGRKEGKIEGKIEASGVMLIDAVRERFGRVPRDVSRTVRQIDEFNILKSLLMQSIKCQDLESFRNILNQKAFHA